MKVLFINKYDISGGAAIAALRISEALAEQFHTENRFLVGIKKSDRSDTTSTRRAGWQNWMERGVNILSSWMGLQYYFFPFSSSNIQKTVARIQPDVISLHNIHGGYFNTRLLEKISQVAPVVWTLHDMWAFTANAAHTFGEDSWKVLQAGPKEHRSFPKTGLARGKQLLARKKEIYQHSRITLVTPSRWLQQLAQQSPALEGKRIEQIYNGVDLEKFCPADSAIAKKRLGIYPSSIVICFSAEKLMSSEYKGGRSLVEILKLLDEQTQIPLHVLIIGQDRIPLELRNLSCTFTGYLVKESDMIGCYQATDIFFYPARADTLPSSLIEAIACGVPCISFNVGGCGEIISDHANGFLIPPADRKSFVEKTLLLAENKTLRQEFSLQARRTAMAQFDIRETAKSYFGLFQSVKSN